MQDTSLVERAQSGDQEAFTTLVARSRDMCLRQATAILGNADLAEDAVQDACLAAHGTLSRLREPSAFESWLRGIVRFQCYRILRRRHALLVSLDHALDLTDSSAGPVEQAEQNDRATRIADAVRNLPLAQQEVVGLFYFGDLSQREIALLLDLPVTSVNNRLHAARRRLKGGLLMERDDRQETIPAEVTGIDGPVFDVTYPAAHTPRVLTLVEFQDQRRGEQAVSSIAQIPATGRARCIATLDRRAPAIDSTVALTNEDITEPLRPSVVTQAIPVLAGPRTEPARMVETGIKAIDLFAPLWEGGRLGLIGDMRAGKLVVIEELLHRLAPTGASLSIFELVEAGHEVQHLHGLGDELPRGAGSIQLAYLAVGDARDVDGAALRAAGAELEAVLYMSADRGRQGLWPAIDPLRSWSRGLQSSAVSDSHRMLAEQARALLHDYAELESATHPDDVEDLADQGREVWKRGRRLRNYLTQPFHVAEPFTKIPGEYVTLADTLGDVQALLEGKYDHAPEDALLFGGTLSQLLAKISVRWKGQEM